MRSVTFICIGACGGRGIRGGKDWLVCYLDLFSAIKKSKGKSSFVNVSSKWGLPREKIPGEGKSRKKLLSNFFEILLKIEISCFFKLRFLGIFFFNF